MHASGHGTVLGRNDGDRWRRADLRRSLCAPMDRLSELRRVSGCVPAAEPARPVAAAEVPRESIEVAALGVQRGDTAATDVESASLALAGSTSAEPVPPEMAQFFESLDSAKDQMAALRRQLDGLDELLRKFKAKFNPHAQAQVRVQIEEAIAALQPDLRQCQRNLKAMQDQLDSKGQLPHDPGDSYLRAQRNLVARLIQDAASMVEKFLTLQKAHETWHHAMVKRQVEISVGGSLSAEEKAAVTEDCLERGASVFKEEADGVLRKKQAEIHQQVEAKHAGAIQVEKNIAELAKLFDTLSLLVDAQGDTIDRVEAHVRDTKLLRKLCLSVTKWCLAMLRCRCRTQRNIRQQL